MITLSNSTANTNILNIFKSGYSVQTSAGCIVEYNMNAMTNLTESGVSTSLYSTNQPKLYPFKKLFPADSVIKNFRPQKAGIKYAIVGDVGDGTYRDPKTAEYPLNYRTYYPGETNSYKYWVSAMNEPSPFLAITYPKDVVTNKIIIKFEISHSIPSTWNVLTTGSGVTNLASGTSIKSGTSSDISGFSSLTPGLLALYYTGSTWSTNAADLNMSAYQTIRTIKLATGQASQYVGIIELSPRLVKDVSDYVKDFSITKESSASQDDIIPVGNITANAITINFNSYNTTSPEMLSYEQSDSFAIDGTKFYMHENVEVKPYISVFHSAGLEGSGEQKHDKIWQGQFYMSSWTDTEFNDVSVTALDGAKFLQETVAPSMLSRDSSIISIIRKLLDGVGFTSYYFNVKKSGDVIVDESIISPAYWWTEDNQTVWEILQELCRDIQLTAAFDEDGVLQFYTREYLYDSAKSVDWVAAHETVDGYIPNIIDMSKNKLPTANQIKILWESALTSEYSADKDPIWSADPSYLTAAALISDLSVSDVTGNYISLKPVTVQNDFAADLILSYSGYLAIDNEIIEYDAVQYEYKPKDNPNISPLPTVDIKNASDILKYKSLAEPSSTAFKPTGKYRIKSRGAFGTTVKDHSSKYDASGWNVNQIELK